MVSKLTVTPKPANFLKHSVKQCVGTLTLNRKNVPKKSKGHKTERQHSTLGPDIKWNEKKSLQFQCIIMNFKVWAHWPVPSPLSTGVETDLSFPYIMMTKIKLLWRGRKE